MRFTVYNRNGWGFGRCRSFPCYLLIVFLLAIGCAQTSQDLKSISPEVSNRVVDLESLARHIVVLLKERKISELVSYVHPEKGLLFSPYAYIMQDSITLKASELLDVWRANPMQTWGYYDGTGEPIKLNIDAYFKSFVYAADFSVTSEVAIDERIGQGNSINNIHQTFPGSSVVEFYVKGMDPRFGGMDWRSLRLVFEKSADDQRWWLVALVNDQWTI